MYWNIHFDLLTNLITAIVFYAGFLALPTAALVSAVALMAHRRQEQAMEDETASADDGARRADRSHGFARS